MDKCSATPNPNILPEETAFTEMKASALVKIESLLDENHPSNLHQEFLKTLIIFINAYESEHLQEQFDQGVYIEGMPESTAISIIEALGGTQESESSISKHELSSWLYKQVTKSWINKYICRKASKIAESNEEAVTALIFQFYCLTKERDSKNKPVLILPPAEESDNY